MHSLIILSCLSMFVCGKTWVKIRVKTRWIETKKKENKKTKIMKMYKITNIILLKQTVEHF